MNINRDSLILISSITNSLNDFHHSLFYLKNKLGISFDGLDLLMFLEKHQSIFNPQKDFFDDNDVIKGIINIINQIINHSQHVNEISIARNIFHYESISSVMKKKFIRQQVIMPRKREIVKTEKYLINPYWELFEAEYDINRLLSHTDSDKSLKQYVIVARNEKECDAFELSKFQYGYLKSIKSYNTSSTFTMNELQIPNIDINKLLRIGILRSDN